MSMCICLRRHKLHWRTSMMLSPDIWFAVMAISLILILPVMARHFYKFNDGPHCPPSCVSLNRWSAHWYLLYRVTCHSSLNQGLINVDSRCQIEPLALFFDWFLFCPQFTCHISVLRRCYLKHQRLQITNHSISQKFPTPTSLLFRYLPSPSYLVDDDLLAECQKSRPSPV